MATMGDKAFIDTNILLRAMIPEMARHAEAEEIIVKLWAEDVDLWINRQVIREYLVQATHPNTFATPLTIEQVARQIETILSLFHVADDTAEVTAHLIALLKEVPTIGKQIHDANIIATMIAYDIQRLATFNPDHMKRFAAHISLITLPSEIT